MIQNSYLYVVISFFCLFGCNNSSENLTEEPEELPQYAIAIAGHIYGNPDSYTLSVYPPFLSEIDSLTHKKKIDLLVLTGDVVAKPTEENWENVKREINELPIDEWHIAPGNHDISPYMDAHVQPYKYKAIRNNNSLILVLNTFHHGWTVDSLQAIFIKDELTKVDSVKNIFVFSHQLWWLNNPPKKFQLDSIRPNSFSFFEGETNFWADAFPFFENLEQEIYFFAGDMGCSPELKGYYEDHFKNYHFYGSGMGGAVEDNFLYLQVFQDATVKIQKIDF